MKLLVDGDIVVYRAGFAVDQTLYEVYVDEESATPDFSSVYMKDVKKWLEENNVSNYTLSRSPAQGSVAAALAGARDILYGMYEKFKPDEMRVFLTGEGNFREDIATYKKYKGNRDTARRPLFYHEIKEYLVKHHDAEIVDGMEADDALGIYAMQDLQNSVICSIDKDLMQIPATHYNWVKDDLKAVSYTEAAHTFYKQCLTGDRSDNIYGIHRVGDKTAEKLLGNDPLKYWDNIVEAYNTLFVQRLPDDIVYDGSKLNYTHWADPRIVVSVTPEEYAQEVAQLVYIRRGDNDEWTRPPLTL